MRIPHSATAELHVSVRCNRDPDFVVICEELVEAMERWRDGLRMVEWKRYSRAGLHVGGSPGRKCRIEPVDNAELGVPTAGRLARARRRVPRLRADLANSAARTARDADSGGKREILVLTLLRCRPVEGHMSSHQVAESRDGCDRKRHRPAPVDTHPNIIGGTAVRDRDWHVGKRLPVGGIDRDPDARVRGTCQPSHVVQRDRVGHVGICPPLEREVLDVDVAFRGGNAAHRALDQQRLCVERRTDAETLRAAPRARREVDRVARDGIETGVLWPDQAARSDTNAGAAAVEADFGASAERHRAARAGEGCRRLLSRVPYRGGPAVVDPERVVDWLTVEGTEGVLEDDGDVLGVEGDLLVEPDPVPPVDGFPRAEVNRGEGAGRDGNHQHVRGVPVARNERSVGDEGEDVM